MTTNIETTVTPAIVLSDYQKKFCRRAYNLARGIKLDEAPELRHIILDAKAGSGKTSTITFFMKYIPPEQKGIAVMFNKRNAQDIQAKLPKTGNIEGCTTHSLGSRICRKNGAGRLPGDDEQPKMTQILKEMQMSFVERALMPQIKKLVSIAKSAGLAPKMNGVYPLMEDTPEAWAGFIDHYSVDFDEPWQEECALGFARQALQRSIDIADKIIDFDDMLYLPVVMRMGFHKYDWVFIDEAQDINPVQREMVKRALKDDGHLVAVGDPNQAIYGFRGADSKSMESIRAEVDAHVMPLSICYRCDKAIVREAQRIVPAIEPCETRGEGIVDTWGAIMNRTSPNGPYDAIGAPERLAFKGNSPGVILKAFTPESVILCPLNAPLVTAALGFIRNKIACQMLGRDFSKGLIKLLERLEALDAQDAEKLLDEYEREESVRLAEKKQENKLQALSDKCATLRAFLEDAPRNEKIDRIVATIQSLFTKDSTEEGGEAQAPILTLCSIHKSKGGEWPRVFLLESGFLSSTIGFKGKQLLPWEIEQRRNLLYVAITRAEHELIYISKDDLEALL